MSLDQHNPRYPEQQGPDKIHGDPERSAKAENTAQKEKYLRDAGKIEDYPENERDQEGQRVHTVNPDDAELSDLTDQSGEEKKEDYINTDERKRDLTRKKGDQR